MDITDNRTTSDFQTTTFSGHTRASVAKAIEENIRLGHADYTCYWILEMLCSGLVHSLWQIMFDSAAKQVNRGCPNIFLKLVSDYEKFSTFEQQYTASNMTNIRNNAEVRELVCGMAGSLALCRKNKLPTFPKIKPEHDFLSGIVQENSKATSASYARHLVKAQDPIEIYVALNEFCYCLRPDVRDYAKGLYWAAWMLKYSSAYKKQHKTAFVCARRHNSFIDDKHEQDVVWLIWDAIKDANKGQAESYIDALFKLHCLRWAPGVRKSRVQFLIVAVMFICENLDMQYNPPSTSNLLLQIPQWILTIKNKN